MRFTWDMSLGQAIITIPLIGILILILKLYGLIIRFRLEHEILMNWWADSQIPKIQLAEIFTRKKGWF